MDISKEARDRAEYIAEHSAHAREVYSYEGAKGIHFEDQSYAQFHIWLCDIFKMCRQMDESEAERMFAEISADFINDL